MSDAAASATGVQGSIRLVIVSDTHRLYDREIPPGDVLIHCGDSEWDAREFEKWAASQPHAHKIAVCGNMDYGLKRTNASLRNVIYLQHSSTVLSGIKIFGSPWTPRFVGVFQLEDPSHAESIWSDVPRDADVFITHGPPKGILDRTSRGKSVGDAELLKRISDIKPRVHCFGHVHESYGTKRIGQTLHCNAAVFNGHAPLVLDLPLDRAKPASVLP